MDRREFLKGAAGAVAIGALAAQSSAAEAQRVDATHLPRWRGFNLLEKFTAENKQPFREDDFAMIAELGFDFVRLPLSYRCWADPSDWQTLNEGELKQIDQAVEFGRKHKVHVNINFHRAPGYCVNPPKEPIDLWTDDKALDTCAFHWAHFAERYKSIPNSRVSFDLLNEPGAFSETSYLHVATRLVEAIREKDPNRLIIADGLRWGTQAVPSLKSLKIAQSTRGYNPIQISHYKANWMAGSDRWPEPTWPLTIKENDVWDKQRLQRDYIDPWKALEKSGVGVHVGEWGAFNYTPHKVVLAWMRDVLDLWKEAGWGWAMWTFRGSFGPLDSGRKDVEYEEFHGHKLDRQMMNLLQSN